MSKLQKIIISAVAAAVLVLSLAGVFAENKGARLGSVNFANEYRSTSTLAAFPNYAVLQSGSGSLGSVVVTLTGTGAFNLYDATSTQTNANWATTTLVSFPANIAAGTYTFDVIFRQGLLLEFTGSGTRASTTITFR